MLRLFCLGTLRLEVDAPVTLTPRANALLIYLAVTGRPHSRDILADLLWGEMNNQRARNNLRYALSDLRQVAGDYLHITPQTVRFLDQRPYWLDVDILRATLTAATQPSSLPEFQAALDLYQGEFLHGFYVRNAPAFEEWVIHQRAVLHTLVVHGLYQLAEGYAQAGEYNAGLTTTQRLLALEPWHEAAHRLRMRLFMHCGQRSAALLQFAECQQVLATELAIAPETETVLLYEQIRSGVYTKSDEAAKVAVQTIIDSQPAAVLRALPIMKSAVLSQAEFYPPHSALPHNLPGSLTPLIGRQQEITDLRTHLFSAQSRLVTLLGEGGTGKTRLALAVAQSIVEHRLDGGDSMASAVTTPTNPQSKSPNQKFPDGVWFVPLSDLTATGDLTEQLAVAVAQAIGWQFSGSNTLVTELLNCLGKQALCLLFDNAEHLLPGLADFLVRILHASPHSMLLVTSRHTLNLQAEYVWRVSGLPVPPVDALTPDELSAYGSSALFMERASRLSRSFQLTTSNLVAIAAICRLVEGLPLAIELAAALTKQYSCPDLYLTLQRDYTILAATFADLSPRHRSIQAMLDYSWRFLSPTESHTLAVCAIFAGGFTAAAAVAVADATPAVLMTLVDQSLLQVQTGRFTMHELVRRYAATQLMQTPADQQMSAARHAAYYINLLHEQAEALLITVDAQRIVQSELDNVRAAWRWSAAQPALPLLDKGAEGLQCFYYLAGLYREGIQLLETARTAVSQAGSPAFSAVQAQALWARLGCYIAQFYRRSGQWDNGECVAGAALAVGQQLADPVLQGLAYHELARLAYIRGKFLPMYSLAEQGYAQARQTNLPQLTAECLNDLGLAVSMCKGPLAALAHFQQAQAILSDGANQVLAAYILVNLGFCYLSCHQYDAAGEHLQQGIALQRLLQIRGGSIMPLLYLGDLWVALGQYQQAFQQYQQIFPLVEAIHSPYSKSCLHISYGHLHHLRHNPTAALQASTYARQLAAQTGLVVQEQWALVLAGHALTGLGNEENARNSYQQAIALHKPENWVYRTADAYAGLAALLLSANEVADAVTHSEAALAILGQYGLAGAHEPFTVYKTAIRVLQAVGDPRAPVVLQTAYQHWLKIAAKLADEAVHRVFLEEVAVNHQLVTMAQAQGLTVDANPCIHPPDER